MEHSSNPRRAFLIAGLWSLLFIVYGSLVPLDFQPKPLDAAWQTFLKTPHLVLGIESRADWVANLLLYILPGFCFSAALDEGRQRAGLLPVAGVFLLCAAVAVAVEFAQLFFPPRTVSLNDLVAELLGSGCGILMGRVAGGRMVDLAGAVVRGGPMAIRAAIVAYVLIYLALSLFPYDFVITAAELDWKLKQGGYHLLVVRSACGGMLECGIRLGAEIAAAAPLGLLYTATRPRRAGRPYVAALLLGLGLGAFIEIAQFFLASGISQGLSVLTRGAGLALGAVVHGVARPELLARARPLLKPLVAATAPFYVGMLMAVNGWFSAAWGGVSEALTALGQVRFLPFYYHYFTTESAALRSLLSLAAAYVPIGVACWMWAAGARRAEPSRPWVAAFIAGALALVMETGKLFVPGKRPDPTDILIAGLAAYLACVVAAAMQRWATEKPRTAVAAPAPRGRASAPAGEVTRSIAALASLPLLAGAGVFLALYPYPGALAAILCVQALIAWRWPRAALPVVLALLPVLDLAPWTGWFFFDEMDAVLLTTVAVLLWRLPAGQWDLRDAGLRARVVLPLIAAYVVSAIIGLAPLHPIDPNAFTSYLSHYNSLRTLKGFGWALILAPLLLNQLKEGAPGQRRLVAGMLAGLAGVALAALWERHVFPGLFDFSTDYRITSTFSSMHMGGAFVEGYLVLAIPFVGLWLYLYRNVAAYFAAAVLLGLASYALVVTFARGGYMGYAVALGILGSCALWQIARRPGVAGRPLIMAASLLATMGAIAVPLLGGAYMQARWATVERDVETRLGHWSVGRSMIDEGFVATVFGMGLGRFPETYFFRNPTGTVPATFRLAREGGNTWLRFSSGSPLYFGQRVTVEPRQNYVVELDLRSRTPGFELDVALCEKSLLYSQECQWAKVRGKDAGGKWEHYRLPVQSGAVGAGDTFARRPVELALTVLKPGVLVEVDNVKFLAPDGRELIRNGDFSRGIDYWFFAGDNHLPWHPKSLALQVFFEQGLLGLAALGLVLAVAAVRLCRAVSDGDVPAGVLLASLSGFLAVGLFDSLFDAPRLATLFFLWLFAAVAMPWRHGFNTKDTKPRRIATREKQSFNTKPRRDEGK